MSYLIKILMIEILNYPLILLIAFNRIQFVSMDNCGKNIEKSSIFTVLWVVLNASDDKIVKRQCY